MYLNKAELQIRSMGYNIRICQRAYVVWEQRLICSENFCEYLHSVDVSKKFARLIADLIDLKTEILFTKEKMIYRAQKLCHHPLAFHLVLISLPIYNRWKVENNIKKHLDLAKTILKE